MDSESSRVISHSADFRFIEAALRARWQPFVDLTQEFSAFVPRTPADFDELRNTEFGRQRALNSQETEQTTRSHVNEQFRLIALKETQLHFEFNARIMGEYVTVVLLSHALVESLINAALAVGLANAGRSHVFQLFERADLLQKWHVGPKSCHAAYELPKGEALYGSLKHLTRERNAFTHYKVNLSVDGRVEQEGVTVREISLARRLQLTRSHFNLPYDLAEHLSRQIPTGPTLLWEGRDPIQPA